jgi:glutathione peroxidase
MKTLQILLITMLMANFGFAQQKSVYDFKVETLSGGTFDFSNLKGKKVMIVNTASKCGFTPQYEQLQKIWSQYGGDNFVIIGFPSNDFLKQEPGTNNEISEFCTINYGVTFPMMSKIHVTGKEMSPVYEWLTDKNLNGFQDSKVKWNFQKYILNEKGELIAVFPSSLKPDDESIINLIK